MTGGLIAISGLGGCGCNQPPIGQLASLGAVTPSRTPAIVAAGVLGLAVLFAYLTEPRR
ncbi:MAG TPA: hypothetical protein VFH61_13650 [Thermoleophilia bacterium]|nr:hypothetical protein [Thermoleophilia bacterium]